MGAVRLGSRLLVGLLLVVACSSGHRVDAAFGELDGALPSQLRQTGEDRNQSAHSARYEAQGEPTQIARLSRTLLK